MLYDPRKLLKPADAAELLGISVSTLAKWRMVCRGPGYLKLGSAVRYDPRRVDEYIEKAACRSTADHPLNAGR
jgi:predicted DNA-binding transcriptional regulator AlpA